MQGVPSDHPPGAVCLITGDLTRYAVSMQSVMALKVPPGSCNAWNMGVLIARSLNGAFKTMMDHPQMQWAWIMGDDHTFEPDCLLRLLDRKVDVVAPLCLNRLPPMDPTIVEHDHEPTGRMKYLEDLPAGGLYKLRSEETCGDAGLLIRRNVLEAIPAPWYDHRVSGAIAAEDQAFVQRIKDTGFDVHIDLDVIIGHIGQVEFKPFWNVDHWEIRLTGGAMRHICDMRPAPRSDDAFRIAAE
jgi:hypothetical protein